MKIINYIKNIIIYLSLVFINISSFTFLMVFIGFKPNGLLIGVATGIVVNVLYDRLKIKENK